MALWLVRGGSHGEHEAKFIEDSRELGSGCADCCAGHFVGLT